MGQADFLSLWFIKIDTLKNIEPNLIKNILGLVSPKAQKIAIVPHVNPDGDAIGSTVGLASIFEDYGHQCTVVSPNDYPAFYDWLTGSVQVLNYDRQKSAAKNAIAQADAVFCLDFNEMGRMGKLKEVVEGFIGPKVLVDHHPFPKDFCDFTVSDTSYSSTAELVFDLVCHLGLKQHINLQAANALFTGIMTDTGSFSHNISNPNTFQVVAELLALGVKADDIHANVYHNYSAQRMKLLGYSLNDKMVVVPEYHTAYIALTKEELDSYNYAPGDTEGFVNYPLSIAGIVFTALFIEKEDHVKISFRSKGSFPANAFSSENFGGGGHLNAAGGESTLPLGETIDKFKKLLPAYQKQLTGSVPQK